MTDSPLFSRLKNDLTPDRDTRSRVQSRLQGKIGTVRPPVLEKVRTALSPKETQRGLVRKRIAERISVAHSEALLTRLRHLLTPHASLRSTVLGSVRFAPVKTPFFQSGLKWSAAALLVAFAVQLTPQFFLAPTTSADSRVMLLPTRGEVSVLVGDLWQPVSDSLVMVPGMKIRTHNGEASIVFHDDGVVRLDSFTTIEIHDTADRLEPAPDVLPTLTLYTGNLWVQGLVPSHLRGITVSTTYGTMTVHEGSASIMEDDAVDVAVWNRRAQVLHRGEESVLVSGERVQLRDNNAFLVKKVASERFDETWVSQNLARDAVHRREIAQLQHVRRVASAGILPTSHLYPVKRVAEAVDVLLTFSQEARFEKLLQHAQTRLREAEALLADDADGAEAANLSLAEYRDTLIALVKESDDGALSQFLLQQSLNEASADVAAAEPGDVIKRAVLEASAALPDTVVGIADVQGELLLDTLSVLTVSVTNGNTDELQDTWIGMKPYLAMLEDDADALSVDVRKEAIALLGVLADGAHQEEGINPQLRRELAVYLPYEPESDTAALTAEQVDEIVQSIYDRIFLYHMTQSRLNQFFVEMKAIDGHPDEGTILRRLVAVLPEGPEQFPEKVQKSITQLQWEKAATL